MTDVDSLNRTLADFQAKRAETMAPDKLRINVDQRRLLVETSNRGDYVNAGDVVEPFELFEVGGERLTRDALLKRGPVVLTSALPAALPAISPCPTTTSIWRRNSPGWERH